MWTCTRTRHTTASCSKEINKEEECSRYCDLADFVSLFWVGGGNVGGTWIATTLCFISGCPKLCAFGLWSLTPWQSEQTPPSHHIMIPFGGKKNHIMAVSCVAIWTTLVPPGSSWSTGCPVDTLDHMSSELESLYQISAAVLAGVLEQFVWPVSSPRILRWCHTHDNNNMRLSEAKVGNLSNG